MTKSAAVLLTALLCYLAGAVPFGYLVGRWRGVDVFEQGSGNIGATNVGRVLGRRFGILVFVLDFLKGRCRQRQRPPSPALPSTCRPTLWP